MYKRQQLKRAGLDYWHFLDIRRYKNVEEFFEKNPNGRYFYLTTKAKHAYTDISFADGDYFLFGEETRGLPEEDVYKRQALTSVPIALQPIRLPHRALTCACTASSTTASRRWSRR